MKTILFLIVGLVAVGLLGCSEESMSPEASPLPSCEAMPPRPQEATFDRISPSHDTSDPLATRLCVEGATLPQDLDNPWDLHCDLAAGHGANAAPEANSDAVLRLVAYNIRFGTELPGVLAALTENPVLRQADVLLLSEVDRGCDRSGGVDVARTIAEALGMDWVFGVEFIEHDQGGCEEGNAILSRYALGNAENQFHNVGDLARGDLHAPFDWSEELDELRSGRRSFVSADVQWGAELLRVSSAHFENRSGPEERGAEALEILDHMDSLPRPVAAIGGDFNVFPNIGDAVVEAPLFDAFASRCFENPHDDMVQADRSTRPRILYQIDFTYTRALRVVDRGVENDDLDPPSDHYPVWVDVAL